MTKYRVPVFSTNGRLSHDEAAAPVLMLGRLREQAALLGITGVAEITSKYALVEAINRKRAEIEGLKAECVALGLPTDGDEAALRLRLAQARPGVVGQDVRRLYRRMGWVVVALALAGLAVSLPHLATGLARITGVGLFYAVLLALVIDAGFAGLKVIDTLAGSFKLSPTVRAAVWVLMGLCLAFSATVNASEFIRSADSPALAVVTAFFLAAFIFSTAMIGSSLLTRCEPRTAPAEENPSTIFRKAAEQYDQLGRLAKLHGACLPPPLGEGKP